MTTGNSSEPTTTPAPRRKFFRFTLRTLLIVMTLTCIVCGVWINGLIRQRTAVRHFYALTANRTHSPNDEELTTMGYRYRGKDQYYKPIIPKWLHPLRDTIGEEAFGEVTGVQLVDTAATDDDLRFVANFPTMERVALSNTKVTDAGLVYLRACPKLRLLTLDNLPITDAGVEQLVMFKDMEELSLSGTKLTDQSIDQIAKLPKLKSLWLRKTAITNDGYLRLQAALPNCQIQADVPAYTQKRQNLNW